MACKSTKHIVPQRRSTRHDSQRLQSIGYIPEDRTHHNHLCENLKSLYKLDCRFPLICWMRCDIAGLKEIAECRTSCTNRFRAVRSRSMRWTEHVVRVGDMRKHDNVNLSHLAEDSVPCWSLLNNVTRFQKILSIYWLAQRLSASQKGCTVQINGILTWHKEWYSITSMFVFLGVSTWFKTFRLVKNNQEKRQSGKLVPRVIRNRCLPSIWKTPN
jgi:hypothetical protein